MEMLLLLRRKISPLNKRSLFGLLPCLLLTMKPVSTYVRFKELTGELKRLRRKTLFYTIKATASEITKAEEKILSTIFANL